jgi:hypothetical protein
MVPREYIQLVKEMFNDSVLLEKVWKWDRLKRGARARERASLRSQAAHLTILEVLMTELRAFSMVPSRHHHHVVVFCFPLFVTSSSWWFAPRELGSIGSPQAGGAVGRTGHARWLTTQGLTLETRRKGCRWDWRGLAQQSWVLPTPPARLESVPFGPFQTRPICVVRWGLHNRLVNK